MISALAVQQYFKLEMIYYTWLSIKVTKGKYYKTTLTFLKRKTFFLFFFLRPQFSERSGIIFALPRPHEHSNGGLASNTELGEDN